MRLLVILLGALLGIAAAAPGADEADYEPTTPSLAKHPVPQWFQDAKLGFMLSLGAYSMPAFAALDNSESKYAEWYWSKMNTPGTPTNAHHKEKYGIDYNYDDFLLDWKADAYDPHEWLELITTGGGKYFVFVSKHHDGIALWDTKYTNRSTAKYGPMRDFLKELVDANEVGSYNLKNGIYYSMPEWYNPSEPVQMGGWMGRGHPHNPYTGEKVPYVGDVPVDDYVMDYQYPQMKELVDVFDPDVIWCDLGGINNADVFSAYYYNKAKNRPKPKEVAVNNRCGNIHYDFTTPEYSVSKDINPAMWEASRGLGHSYGYNAQETEADTLKPVEVVHAFVDIVSKNGNFLINIGFTANGTLPELQASRVRALGAWLKVNGEAFYGSRYWKQPDDKGASVPVRFTTLPKAFYITAFEWPGSSLHITAHVPIDNGDQITLLGHDKPLTWRRTASGELDITMPPKTGEYAWTFRIASPGFDPVKSPKVGVEIRAPTIRVGHYSQITVSIINHGDNVYRGGDVILETPFGGPSSQRLADLNAHTHTTLLFGVPVPNNATPGTQSFTVIVAGADGELKKSIEVVVIGDTEVVDLTASFNGDAIASAEDPSDGQFGYGPAAYPSDELPSPGVHTFDFIKFLFPDGTVVGKKNVYSTDDSSIAIPTGRYIRLHLLIAAAYGPAVTNATVTYEDGSSTDVMSVDDWVTGESKYAIKTTHRYAWGALQVYGCKIFQMIIPVNPKRRLVSLKMSKAVGPSTNSEIVVFSVSAEKAVSDIGFDGVEETPMWIR